MKTSDYRTHLSFGKLNNRLHFENTLDELLSRRLLFSDQIFDWRGKEIRHICILHEESLSESSLEDIRNECAVAGLKTSDVPLKNIDFHDFAKVTETIEEMIHLAKNESFAFLFSGKNKQKVYLFAAGLILYIRKDLSPEQAIKYVSGREGIQKEDAALFEFEKHINKNYKIPDQISRLLKGESKEIQEGPMISTTSAKPVIKEKDIPAPEPKKVNSESENTKQDNFHASRWTIQLKLMSIISGIIIFSISGIIVLATYFFKNDNEVRVKENNIKLTEVISMKVKTDFTALAEKANLIATTIRQEFKTKEQKALFTDLFFKNDKDLVSLGIYSQGKRGLEASQVVTNGEFLKENQLTEKELENLINLHGSKFLKSFSGAAVVHNASPGFKIPILGISLPLASDSDEKMIIVMFIRLEKLLTAFQASGITETFMVNDEGSVVAHPDSKVVLSGSNLIDNPIVKAMMTSTLDNGQTRYKDKDGVYHLGSFKKLGIAGAGIVSTVSEDRAFEAVYNIQKRNIYIMIIAVCFAILVVYFFARSMTTPIQRLLGATKQIESGDFRVTIHPETGDEIGILTHSFIDMGKGLEEKEKVKSILGGMIDPTVVKEAMVDLAALKRGSEKEITAFFSDVAGFSTISEQLVSVDLAALLNEYLGAMTIILKNHDGVLDKYIGDAIVAIFNAPVDVPNHCLAAAKASLEMIQKLSDQRKYWTEHNMYCKDAQEMDVRIGLNTGLAKVGFMGTEKLASYTMMGDTVNLAARLEAAGKDYGVNILISETVNARVKEEMFTRELDLVRVKGKNEPVRLYELIAKRSEIADNIAESALLYEEGLNHYLKHEWDKAIEKLEKAEKVKGKKDKAAHQLIDRCEDYKKHPPGKDWDGVFTRTHK